MTDTRLHQSCSATARHRFGALLHWRQLHPSSLSCHSEGGSGTSHTLHPGSSSYLPENKTLVKTVGAACVLLCSGSSYHSQVEKVVWSQWLAPLKRLLELQQRPLRFLNWARSFEFKAQHCFLIPTTDPIMPHSFQQKKGETSFFCFTTPEPLLKWQYFSAGEMNGCWVEASLQKKMRLQQTSLESKKTSPNI